MSINRITLSGRVTRDPELRQTQSGKSVCDFSIQVEKRIRTMDDSKPYFFRCQCWDSTAKFMANYVTKGALIGVEGHLVQREYVASDGTRREVVEIMCDMVERLDAPRPSEPSDQADRLPPGDRPVVTVLD